MAVSICLTMREQMRLSTTYAYTLEYIYKHTHSGWYNYIEIDWIDRLWLSVGAPVLPDTYNSRVELIWNNQKWNARRSWIDDTDDVVLARMFFFCFFISRYRERNRRRWTRTLKIDSTTCCHRHLNVYSICLASPFTRGVSDLYYCYFGVFNKMRIVILYTSK